MKNIRTYGKRRLARAHARLKMLDDDPGYIERISMLAVADLLEMARERLISPQEARTLQRCCSRSEEAKDILDALMDALIWSRSEEGTLWRLRLKYDLFR